MADDKPPQRTTRLYGAVDLVDEHYPPTIIEQARTSAASAVSPVVGSMLERYRIGDVLGQALMASHRKLIKPWLLALVTCTATMSPWILAIVGVLPDQISVAGNTLQLHTAAIELEPEATLAGMVIYIIALIHLAALLSRLQDDDRRKTRRAMQLQSWTLRQLVPRPTSRPPK